MSRLKIIGRLIYIIDVDELNHKIFIIFLVHRALVQRQNQQN